MKRKTEKPSVVSRVPFSLRLTPELHAKLVERAGKVPLNVFLVDALEKYLELFPENLPELVLLAGLNRDKMREVELERKNLRPLSRPSKVPKWKTREEELEIAEEFMSDLRDMIVKTVRDSVHEALAHKPPEPPKKS